MIMDKDAWGPNMWTVIHAVALGYPESGPTADDKRHYRSFYEGLQHVIPCMSCRENFKKHIEKLPIDLTDQSTLFKWTVDLHNAVNKMTGKSTTWDVDGARRHYLGMNSHCGTRPGLLVWLTIIGVLLLTLAANVVLLVKNSACRRKN